VNISVVTAASSTCQGQRFGGLGRGGHF